MRPGRYAQCDDTCTVDCGACKGNGPPAGERCGCAHVEGLHHPAGRCTVKLPAFPEDELPAWGCPCRKFTAAPVPGWRWHEPTQTWQLVPPAAVESAA